MINKYVSKVHRFVREQKECFSTENVANAIFHKRKTVSDADIRSLNRWLRQYPDIFMLGEDTWKSKESLFKGTKFRILLEGLELENCALLPGQRVVPYMSSFLGHADSTFTDGDGKVLKKMYKRYSFEEVYSYFFLLPIDMWDSERDHLDSNIIDFNNQTIDVPLYDLSELFPQGIERGSSLILEVLSSTRASFQLQGVSAEETKRQLLQASSIDAKVEQSMLRVMEKQQFSIMSPDILFFYSLAEMTENLKGIPGHPISQLVMDSKLFACNRSSTGLVSISLEGKPVLEENGQQMEETAACADVFESLDDVFSEFELSMSREELEPLAYGMSLMSWNRNKILNQLLPARVIALLYPEELESIYHELSKLMTKVRRNIAKKNWEEGKIEFICKITDHYFLNLETLREIDSAQLAVDNVPEQVLIDNAEITGLLISMLWLLVDDEGSAVPHELEMLVEMAKSSKHTLRELLANHLSASIH